MTDTARVILWGSDIGAVTWLPDREIGVFQYTPEFAASDIRVAPMMMPLTDAPYEFPSLSRETFKGLPGLLADSLPDKFGNALINAWLSRRGREPGSFTPVERLCYTGTRGMGALEFRPLISDAPSTSRQVDIEALVALANRVLDDRIALEGKFTGVDDQHAIEDILRVGTSAGGARAKAVLAWNPDTGEFRSGQAPAEEGFSQWLMKFDGVEANRDKELADPQGFGRIEYAYSLMARAAGIDMEDCHLHLEGGRAHFMTRRFDRTDTGAKLHMQSLVARNQDDHVKNIAFLMDRQGVWRLSPAFDVAYSYNPSGAWTRQHQMSVNGKRERFEIDDLIAFAGVGGIKPARAKAILAEVSQAVAQWHAHAVVAEIPDDDIARIARAHRHNLFY